MKNTLCRRTRAPEPWYERLNPWLVAVIIILLLSIPSTVEWWLK